MSASSFQSSAVEAGAPAEIRLDVVHEYAVEPEHVVGPRETALDSLLLRAGSANEDTGFHRWDGLMWIAVSYGQVLEMARSRACSLVEADVQPGDRVALMSRTRLEWTVWDYAIWLAGAVSVPVYETSSAEQVAWILEDSGAVVAVVETAENADLIAGIEPPPAALRHVWTFEGRSADEAERRGRLVLPDVLEQRRQAIGSDSPATIVYTSGTTGRPKGCLITHGNLVSVYSNTCNAPGIPEVLNEQASVLLFLPLAHVLARMIELSCVHAGAPIAYSPDVRDLPAQLRSFRPTLLLSVPRIFEKVYNTARHDAKQRHLGHLFAAAEKVAIGYGRQLEVGRPSPALRGAHALFDLLIYRRLRAALGGRLQWAVSGGAPLGARLGYFFRGAGITILEGYGLTETAAGATLNLPGRQKIGTVGPPAPGCGITIGSDGEVLIRAPFVMAGYWNNESATKEAIDEGGWLHTGDLGALDGEGYLSITGRKKEILVTSGGKNVAPAVLEDRLRAHELISQCIVVGDARPYIGCLLTLDEAAIAQWRLDHVKAHHDVDPRKDPALLEELQRAVDDANAAVSHAEAIRRWRVLDSDFTEENGELTPTLKLKRSVIVSRHQQEVEDLYA